jgi:hypothetical protein
VLAGAEGAHRPHHHGAGGPVVVPPSSATSQPRSVPGRSQEAPGVEQGAWLAAITQDQADRDRTLRDLLGNLEAKLASMPRGGP